MTQLDPSLRIAADAAAAILIAQSKDGRTQPTGLSIVSTDSLWTVIEAYLRLTGQAFHSTDTQFHV